MAPARQDHIAHAKRSAFEAGSERVTGRLECGEASAHGGTEPQAIQDAALARAADDDTWGKKLGEFLDQSAAGCAKPLNRKCRAEPVRE
jgi:hypothetical protein